MPLSNPALSTSAGGAFIVDAERSAPIIKGIGQHSSLMGIGQVTETTSPDVVIPIVRSVDAFETVAELGEKPDGGPNEAATTIRAKKYARIFTVSQERIDDGIENPEALIEAVAQRELALSIDRDAIGLNNGTPIVGTPLDTKLISTTSSVDLDPDNPFQAISEALRIVERTTGPEAIVLSTDWQYLFRDVTESPTSNKNPYQNPFSVTPVTYLYGYPVFFNRHLAATDADQAPTGLVIARDTLFWGVRQHLEFRVSNDATVAGQNAFVHNFKAVLGEARVGMNADQLNAGVVKIMSPEEE